MKKNISLKKLCNSLSLISIMLALIVSVVISIIIFCKYSKNVRESEINRLQEIYPLILRPIQANYITGDARSKKVLIAELLEKYHLSRIIISKDENICPKVNNFTNFNLKDWFLICITMPFSHNNLNQYIVLESKSLKYNFDLLIVLFLLVNFPMFFLGLINALILRKKLDKFIVKPIKSLSENPKTIFASSVIHVSEIIYLQNKISDYIKKLNWQRNIIEDNKIKESIFKVTTQVAHDIRSPLAALNILTTQNAVITEQSIILMRNAINRIRDIANDIVEKNRDLRSSHMNIDDTSTQLLAAIIYPLVTEKRLQLRSSSNINIVLELSSRNYGLFVRIKLSEFKRMLSNIIDNAIEAISGKGTILIRIHSNNDIVHLTISDNGNGMPSSVLKKIGQYGVTYNKQYGSGLGLYHAKKTMKLFGGALNIISELGKGTDIILDFPRVDMPKWFFSGFEIVQNSTIVILDDNLTIHELWEERFKSYGSKVTLINFTTPKDFFDWRLKNQAHKLPFLYLFDLEFVSDKQTGINIIEESDIQKDSVLITSHFENIDIHKRCEKLGIKIIPKDLAVFVPITFC